MITKTVVTFRELTIDEIFYIGNLLIDRHCCMDHRFLDKAALMQSIVRLLQHSWTEINNCVHNTPYHAPFVEYKYDLYGQLADELGFEELYDTVLCIQDKDFKSGKIQIKESDHMVFAEFVTEFFMSHLTVERVKVSE